MAGVRRLVLPLVAVLLSGCTALLSGCTATPPAPAAGDIPAPGTLLASEPLAAALSLPGAGRAFRFRYATTDVRGQPAVSTAAAFLPPGTPPPDGWPVLAWAHGTVGLGDDCTPSAHPRGERDAEYLDHWLAQGYAVVASDYTGLGTPGLMSYLSTTATAHAVVDSVRGLQDLARAESVALSPRWVVVGQSQGGAGAVATARYATEFAADSGLDYRGAVATGTPAFLEDLVAGAGPDLALPPGLGPIATAYSAYILAGFRDARPDLDVDATLSPAGRDAVDRAERLCTADLAASLDGVTPDELFRAPLASVPGVRDALTAYLGIPVTGYDRPLFLGVGLRDRDVPPSSSLRLADALRAHGQPVELHVYPDQDHSGTVLASLGDSTPFLRRVLG